MKKSYLLVVFVLFFSCNEKLIEKPDNLISKEKMQDILKDLAILNAAKSTDINILRRNNIEPMQYVYARYGVDSLQFVESDRYYASVPEEYEAIYMAVHARLEKEKTLLEDAKKIKDSILREKNNNTKKPVKK